jgi:heterodisulfide reductase subunit A
MADAGRHPNIELYTNSTVEEVTGYVGNFRARIHKRSRFVIEGDCTACGDCVDVCPVVVPSEFEVGLGSRRAIYQPFPQAVPSAFLIDMDNCLGTNPIACGKCAEVCEKGCIDYDMKDEDFDVEVGTVVVATGMEVYDPTELDEFGYTRHQNVITSLEFERLINAGGPTEGHLIRPTDHKQPKTIAFIQCVGSRTTNGRGNPYCSNICCMNTVKDSLLIKDHYPDVDVKVFYMDIRAFGKGFEDLYRMSKSRGTKYIRGIPGEIEELDSGSLLLHVEDTLSGELQEHEVDMVVLAVGTVPRRDNKLVKQLLTLSTTSDGFFMEAHPKLQPVDAPTRGVFFAGCAEFPKDVKDSVTQAGAAAARANILMAKGMIHNEAINAWVDEEACSACGLCGDVCPYHAIEVDKVNKIKARVIEASCAGCGTCAAECPIQAISMRHFEDQSIYAQIDAILADNPQDKIVAFACNWCSYAGGDGAGTARLQYPPNVRLVRTMCSGRVDQKFILYAFERGAPLVLVSGCHFADCHYIDANRWTQRRVERLWNRLEKKDIRPERLQLEWISAAEGQKFARVMKEIEEMRAQVTPEEVTYTMEALAPHA